MIKRMCEPLVTLFIAGVLYAGCLAPVEAQNIQCTTRPTGDSTNACASTAFVQSAITSLSLAQGAIFGGNSSSVAIAKQVSLAVPVTPITRATIQAAIDEIASFGTGGGGWLQIGAGNSSIDTSTPLAISTGSVVIRCGGADTTTGTALTASSASGNMFTITTQDSVTMSECGITGALAKSAGTAGISLDDAATGDPRSKKFLFNLRINGQYDGIKIDDSFQADIFSNLITGSTHYGIVHTQPDVADSGAGWAIGNKIWSISDVGAAAGIKWNRGSRWLASFNRVLGAFDTGYDIEFDKTSGDDGANAIIGNSFEVQDLYGTRLRRTAAAQAAGRTIGQIVHALNFTQSLTSGYQNPLRIEQSSGGPWVLGMIHSLNTHQNSIAALLDNCMFNFADGRAISSIGNIIYHVGSGDGGYCTSGNAADVLIAHPLFIGGTDALKYPTINASTTIIDHRGLALANFPATVAPGSMLRDTTNSVMKLYQAAAWHTVALLSVAQSWTAVQTFTAPVLGAATATSINGLAITTCTSCTLTIPNSGTLQQTGAFTLNLTVTAGTTPTFPVGAGTLAYLAGTNTWSGVTTFSNATASSAAGAGAVVLSAGGLYVTGDYFSAGNFRLDRTSPAFRLNNTAAGSGSQAFAMQNASGIMSFSSLADGFASHNPCNPSFNLELGTSSALAYTDCGGLRVGGHFRTADSRGAPAVSACGTTPAVTSGSTDMAGQVTTGTATPTSCTLTFFTAYASEPFCLVNGKTAAQVTAFAVTTTTIIVTTTATNNVVWNYTCVARTGG